MATPIREILQQIARYSLLSAKGMLTMEEAAIYLGLSQSHLYKLTCSKQIPHSKPNGKTIYFSKDELNEWMSQNRVLTQEEAEQEAARLALKYGNK